MKRQQPFQRGAGVLLAVSSLPSPYGIGTFGDSAYRFVDFLKRCGGSYWQVLPLGPTGYGDSPYQSFSAFAGNPYLIDPEILMREGLLKREDAEAFSWGENPKKVDYEKLYAYRMDLLRIAWRNSRHKSEKAFFDFCRSNAFWLDDYARFQAIKKHYAEKCWLYWPEEIRTRKQDALAALCETLEEEIDFYKFCQFHFFAQWKKLKEYANQNGVSIIGDIPIYVALDSSDVWAGQEEFLLGKDGRPEDVAGVPPDEFSDSGQLWGNPLYRWDEMEKNGFTWWKLRMGFAAKMYDVIRIDHFIGIVRYYAVRSDRVDAKHGKWRRGPGEKLLTAISEVIGETKIIAEDLGAVTPAVKRLRLKAGYPGMKILSYGFGEGAGNENLPHNFEKNCVVYGGTHDNEPLAGYFKHADETELLFAKHYFGVRQTKALCEAVVRAGYASVADLCLFQIQDLLGLDHRYRMNTPATVGGNWTFRITDEMLSDELSEKLYELTYIYGRGKEE
ncbi:MAG: 4-alpha-glucanotransferase [Clostridia bacterium]|nr:4-alpha-glucanotransferase [Clostridia bacterium]